MCVSYSIVNDELLEWDVVLAKWIGLIKTWCDRRSDTPFARTAVHEETLASLLSSAATSQGCVSAVELPIFKAHTDDGKNDLFIEFPSSGNEYYAESKFIGIETGDDSVDINVKTGLDQACQDVLDIDFKKQRIKRYVPMGMLFISPTYLLDSEGAVSAEINSLLDCVHNIEKDAAAWCFPKSKRQYRVDKDHLDWPVCPGLVLLMKIASDPTTRALAS